MSENKCGYAVGLFVDMPIDHNRFAWRRDENRKWDFFCIELSIWNIEETTAERLLKGDFNVVFFSCIMARVHTNLFD